MNCDWSIPVLDVIEADVGGDDAGEERHQGALLQLVNQDGRVTLPCRAHGQANGGVPGDGNIEEKNEIKLDQFMIFGPANLTFRIHSACVT